MFIIGLLMAAVGAFWHSRANDSGMKKAARYLVIGGVALIVLSFVIKYLIFIVIIGLIAAAFIFFNGKKGNKTG